MMSPEYTIKSLYTISSLSRQHEYSQLHCVQVVLYDRSGIFSAPRVWWTFKAFGHDRCASLLNTGAPLFFPETHCRTDECMSPWA